MTNPICDLNPDHGEMQPEPMYNKDEIVQYGYFCQVEGCDGYGGPVPKKAPKPAAEPEPTDPEQLSFL